MQYANGQLKHKILFGSDYPLITPDRWMADFEQAGFKPEVRPLILKENAAKLLGLDKRRRRDAPFRCRRCPGSLSVAIKDDIAIVTIERAAKRNALDDPTVLGLGDFFLAPPKDVKAVVLQGAGEHFCAGLDLSELQERTAVEGVLHSRLWHEAFDHIQFGKVPVVAVLHGAVVGGGLELAAAAHIRVADAIDLLRPARGPARHLRRRRRFGAHPAPDRRCAHDRHDADRRASMPRPRRAPGSACRNICAGEGEGLKTGIELAQEDRRQRADDQFRRDARPAAHRRFGARTRACSPSR